MALKKNGNGLFLCTNAGWYEGKDILIYSDAISKMRQIRTNLVVEISKRTVA